MHSILARIFLLLALNPTTIIAQDGIGPPVYEDSIPFLDFVCDIPGQYWDGIKSLSPVPYLKNAYGWNGYHAQVQQQKALLDRLERVQREQRVGPYIGTALTICGAELSYSAAYGKDLAGKSLSVSDRVQSGKL